jgi:alkaline phosphatase
MENYMKKNFLKISKIIICLIVVVAFFVAGLPSVSGSGPTGPTVKNVILLIGDGMGPAHVELTRLCLGGSELAMEEMDETGPSYMTTYCLDREDQTTHEITDSAAAGSAIATGYKTYYRAVSVDFEGNSLETALERAEAEDKATGLVTDVYIQDATPSAFVVHAERRGDSMLFSELMVSSDVEVLMGAGSGFFLPKGKDSQGGQRTDGRNLIEEWENKGGTYVDSAEELADAEINLDEGDRLLGLFGGLYNMVYDLDRQQDEDIGAPTLVEMTEKAIEVLSQDPDGFFLMVEGGSLDWVAHDRDVAGVVTETATFDEAVQVALDFAAEDGETLVVVTADHECGGLQMTSDSVKDEPPTYVPISETLDVDFIMGITATTAYMWGEIKDNGADLEDTVEAYTGYVLSPAEVTLINGAGKKGQLIISDILSAEADVVWGFAGKDEGEHTFAPVPIYAYGPNAERFDAVTDNTEFGQELFVAVSGYWH